jgi:hypothetical protein
MASTYSTNLALELIGTGEQSGTWGTTTNTNLGTLLEQAISGYVTQAITDGSGANTTITIPNGTTGVARNMFIEMTGALSFSTTSLIVPANKKMYFVFNNTSGGFAVTVKVSGQTGILVPNGKKVVLTCNGTDIVEAHTAIVGNATMGGTLGVTGATTLAAVTGTSIAASTVLQMPDGVVGVPGLRVGSSSSTGLFSSGDNSVRVASGGTQVALFTSTGINSTAVGVTTPAAGAFTTLSASATLGVTGVATFTASPVISAITNTGTLTLPTLTGTVGLATRTVQVFTSGSGTYTTPTGCKSIWVRAIGGGGGGAGSGTGSVNGTAGGNTTFGAFTAGGGVAGTANSGVSVAGGTVSGSPTVSIAGGRGGGGSTLASTQWGAGNLGGSGVFGGAGAGGQGTQPADPAVANSGGGGGGAGINPSSASVSGGGGGSGAYFENYYSSPAATYSYGIGAGGTAGTAGTSSYGGGAGGSGVIIVTESY